MSVEIIKLLRKTPIFSTLESSSLKKISGFFKEKTFSSGEVIFKEGTLGDVLYIIKAGAIRITQIAKEGEEETAQVLRREGDVFGESGFLDESPRPVTAQATKETKVLQLSRSDFLTILNDHPLIAYQIVKVLSSRLKQSDLRMIEELKEKNEQLQKAYHALQEMAEKSENQGLGEKSSTLIKEKESLSLRLLSSVPYPVVYTDENDVISFFNKSAEEEFGYNIQEVKGKSVGMLWSEASWSNRFPEIQKELKERNLWEGEIIAKKKNGGYFLFLTTVSEVLNTQGKNEGKLYISQNVTQKRSQEREERMKEELISRQLITAEITSIMEREVEKLSEAYESLPFELDEINLNKSLKTLTVMRDALKNIRGIISNMTQSNLPEAKKEPIDLVSFIEEELLLLKSQKNFRDISFGTHFEKEIPKVEGDRYQWEYLLHAILDNAAFALSQVSNRVKTITLEVNCINKKKEIQILISDNGMGINPANLSKVFKERFTTKKDGLGLGLLSVAGIVKRLGGRIEVQSDEGTYTLFVVKLPAYEEKLTSLPPADQVVKVHA